MPSGNVISVPALITKKRDGKSFTDEEIQSIIRGVVEGEMQDSQIGALLMAMYLSGMNTKETVSLTRHMMNSGETLSWPADWLMVDKHSTGGVGDKVSLPLAPALAALGLKVPMISGRGLGHTGGTLDKLESIPGFSVSQSSEQMHSILEEVGCCIVGQTADLVPADKKLYMTRDVTATVESPPLIAASIVSKKAAEGLSALVLDVKYGNGSTTGNEETARELAETMVYVSNGLGIKTVAVLSQMNFPLGATVGNALEVMESIQCLQGKGPQDLEMLVCTLGSRLLQQAGKFPSTDQGFDQGYKQLKETLHDDTALTKFKNMMIAQGVTKEKADKLCDMNNNMFSVLPEAHHQTKLTCPNSGFVQGIHAQTCALVSGQLGAGRTKAGEKIDPAVGLQLLVNVGDQVKKGDPWVVVHHSKDLPEQCTKALNGAICIGQEKPSEQDLSLVKDVILPQ